jgi:DNA-binding Lrp family transcriptional regulator
MEAFILLKAVGDHRKLMENLSTFRNVSKVYNIAGDNDILINVKTRDLEGFKELINKIRSMNDVINTTSYLVLQKFK